MAAQEVAQSVPQPFYCGPHSMVAPHLPVGSPEREALFRELRRTFCEDWKAAEEAVALERERAKGDHLYFIRSVDAVKIGRTTNIVNRLTNMQANNHEELDCVLLLKHRGKDEADWHRRFRHCRLRGEWFQWASDLECAVLEARDLNRLASISAPLGRQCEEEGNG